MTQRANIEFDWQAKERSIAVVSMRQPVIGWASLDDSDGKKRDPEREELTEPWPTLGLAC